MCSVLMTRSELDAGQGSIPQAGPEVAVNAGWQSDAEVPGMG